MHKWDYEWTGFNSLSGAARWHNKDSGLSCVLFDEIKFQNGFGAWQRMNYFCNYDPLQLEGLML